MVAEVCLGKVGAVCAREVSRFARNSRDWQHLSEMCRMVDTDSGRTGDHLSAEARQRPPAARAQGQPQRVRTGFVAPTLALGTL
nr:hypothetical protein [Bradyrhizobium sp. 138]